MVSCYVCENFTVAKKLYSVYDHRLLMCVKLKGHTELIVNMLQYICSLLAASSMKVCFKGQSLKLQHQN